MGHDADTRERLLRSALDLIYARSYAGVGVQAICDRAGVKKGSFYHFFPSKRDLTLAAIQRQWDVAKQTVWEVAWAGPLPLRRKLERCFELFYEHQCGAKAKTGRVPGCPFGNLVLELGTQDDVIRLRVNAILQECAGYVERGLREAIAAGELPEQDAGAAAEAVIVFMEGVMLMAKARNDPKVIKGLRDGLFRFLQAEQSAQTRLRGKTRKEV